VPFSNATHYASPEADRLLEDAAVENDPAKRRTLFIQFQELVGREVPDINICSPVFLTLSNTRLHDEAITAEGVESGLADAWVDA
jgi:peptide/nickel transport system substrate-binding protein